MREPLANEVWTSQIRLPAEMHVFIQQEAAKMGVAQNAFLITLISMGRKLWEADVTHLLKVQ